MTSENFIKSVCNTLAHCYACRTNEFVREGFEKTFGPFECPLKLPIGWKPKKLPDGVCPYMIQQKRKSKAHDCNAIVIECQPPEWPEPGIVTARQCGMCKHNKANKEK